MEASAPAIAKPRSVPGQLLAPTEQIIFELKPSRWFILFDSFRWLMGLLLVWGLLYVDSHRMASPLLPDSLRLQLAQASGACAAGRLLWATMQWLALTYVLTDRRAIRVRGVFNVEVFECPLQKIQSTYLRLPLAQRLVRTGTIDLMTAGSGQVEASWGMVKRPMDVLELLREAIEKARRLSPN